MQVAPEIEFKEGDRIYFKLDHYRTDYWVRDASGFWDHGFYGVKATDEYILETIYRRIHNVIGVMRDGEFVLLP